MNECASFAMICVFTAAVIGAKMAAVDERKLLIKRRHAVPKLMDILHTEKE